MHLPSWACNSKWDIIVSENGIDVGYGSIKVTSIREPEKLPWDELNVDVVLECTGLFASKEKAELHLKAGAKKVLVSAPVSGADITVVYGVNHTKITKDHKIISNNPLNPYILVIDCGIKNSILRKLLNYNVSILFFFLKFHC